MISTWMIYGDNRWYGKIIRKYYQQKNWDDYNMRYWYNCDKCEHRNILVVPIYFSGQDNRIEEYRCEECGHHIAFLGNGPLQFYNRNLDRSRYGTEPTSFGEMRRGFIETTVSEYDTGTDYAHWTSSTGGYRRIVTYRIIENADGTASIAFE